MRRYYSLFTLGMLVMFECTVVGQRLRNLRELRSLTTPKQALQVYRQGKWVQLPGDALLPGDVISIGRPSGGTFLPSALPNLMIIVSIDMWQMLLALQECDEVHYD